MSGEQSLFQQNCTILCIALNLDVHRLYSYNISSVNIVSIVYSNFHESYFYCLNCHWINLFYCVFFVVVNCTMREKQSVHLNGGKAIEIVSKWEKKTSFKIVDTFTYLFTEIRGWWRNTSNFTTSINRAASWLFTLSLLWYKILERIALTTWIHITFCDVVEPSYL